MKLESAIARVTYICSIDELFEVDKICKLMNNYKEIRQLSDKEFKEVYDNIIAHIGDFDWVKEMQLESIIQKCVDSCNLVGESVSIDEHMLRHKEVRKMDAYNYAYIYNEVARRLGFCA